MNLDRRNLYRLPWSVNDNPVAWLEVTDICNMRCRACYRKRMTGHRSMEQIKKDVVFLKRWRNPDSVSIAGGEPLTHPDIVEIVAFIAERGLKPIIFTNALRLDRSLLLRLKRAGLTSFTIHIDSQQERPPWSGKSESDLNALRQEYADLIADVGGMCTLFISTIYPSTIHEIPAVVRWGQANIDRVQGLVFVTYRTVVTNGKVGLVGGSEVELGDLIYATESLDEEFVMTRDIYRIIKQTCPEYEPSSYLGGTIVHDSFKWTFAAMIGTKHQIYGSMGKRAFELSQTLHHLGFGTYVIYPSHPRRSRKGFLSGLRSLPNQVLAEHFYWLGRKGFLLGLLDTGMRQAAVRYLHDILKRPWRLFASVHMQSITILQPPDQLPDNLFDMCDGCPDMTVWEGKLVPSCHMDDYRLFGGFVTLAQREQVSAAVSNGQQRVSD